MAGLQLGSADGDGRWGGAASRGGDLDSAGGARWRNTGRAGAAFGFREPLDPKKLRGEMTNQNLFGCDTHFIGPLRVQVKHVVQAQVTPINLRLNTFGLLARRTAKSLSTFGALQKDQVVSSVTTPGLCVFLGTPHPHPPKNREKRFHLPLSYKQQVPTHKTGATLGLS